MRVMGIDPGSQVTGYGIIDCPSVSTLHYVDAGCIKTGSRHAFSERLKTIYDGISELVRKFRPDEIAFEDIFYGKNVRAAFQLGQARGAAIIAAINANLAIAFYSPASVKQAVTGHGAATKEQVQKMMSGMLHINLAGQRLDASDALAIAVCHSHRTWSERNLNR
jgi:crossover junction endodeoxyribonuclease RuvC